MTYFHWLSWSLFSLCILLSGTSVDAQPVTRPGGSAEVLYSFPKDPGVVSVGRNGENTFALKIPTFPAYLTSQVAAVYSSRGSDGVMGIGWSLALPEIALDLTGDRDALVIPPRQAAVSDG